MLAIFGLSIAGGGAMLYFANKILQNRSSDVVSLKLESREQEEQQNAFRQAKSDVEKYKYLNDIIKSALPADKDQARTVREIFLLAGQAGITVKSVTFPSSTLGAVTSAAAAVGTAASAAPTAAITQAKPVEGLKGVYSIETVVIPNADGKTYKVSYNQLIDFLQRIETNRRAMQVASIQLTPLGQASTDSISFTLTLNIFIKP